MGVSVVDMYFARSVLCFVALLLCCFVVCCFIVLLFCCFVALLIPGVLHRPGCFELMIGAYVHICVCVCVYVCVVK